MMIMMGYDDIKDGLLHGNCLSIHKLVPLDQLMNYSKWNIAVNKHKTGNSIALAMELLQPCTDLWNVISFLTSLIFARFFIEF